MARQRRGGGFRPPEIRGTLGTLLRTAAAQVGPLRDALERTAREGRTRVSDALSNLGNRRQDALAELGEIVLDLIRRGEIDLSELPEVRDIVAHLDEVDAGEAEHDHDAPPPPAVRERFDRRRDDGTVSSRAWARTSPSAPAKKASAKVWRPPVDDEPAATPPPTRHRAVPLPKDPQRKGGISFDDDEDLSEYMHPDDVPSKGPPSDE